MTSRTIALHDVSRRYARTMALSGVSFEQSSNKLLLLGPNGAGKSTLLSICAGITSPTAGSVRLGDLRLQDDVRRFRSRIGWMPQQVPVVPSARVRDQVAMHGWLKGMARSAAWDAAAGALDAVGLGQLAGKRVAHLSGGQRARLGVAQVLVHDADVLLLDEPTAALDPATREDFAALIDDVAQTRSVIVSTHDVHDAQTLYDEVVLLSAGQVRFHGRMGEFLTVGGCAVGPVEAYRHHAGLGNV